MLKCCDGTLALIHSASEYYCAPAWCRSKHTRLVDKPVHTRCLAISDWMPSPYLNRQFFVLAGIIPTKLRRKRATLSLAHREMDPNNCSTIDSCSHQLHYSENSNRGTLCTCCVGTSERSRYV